jgi:TnpA family transposase
MKPINPQATLNDDAEIEALLRREAKLYRDQYIDNAGFSDRVMAQIAIAPARATPALSNQARLTIIAGMTFLAILIAMTLGAGSIYLIDAVMDLATQTITPAVIGLVSVVVAAGVMAFSAASND